MSQIGETVMINDKGMLLVKMSVKGGRCAGPIPESLEGLVVRTIPWVYVRLPLIRRDVDGNMTDEWPFAVDEIVSINQ